MSKIKQHSTAPKKVTRKQLRKEMDSELSMYCWNERLYASPPERLNLLADDLLLMLDEDPHMFTTQAWLRKHKLTKRQVDHYRNKYPEFKERWIEAKERIAWRIWERSFNCKGHAGMASMILPYFSDTFKDLEEWRSFIKSKQEESGSGVTVVEIPTFKSSGLVPDKEEK